LSAHLVCMSTAVEVNHIRWLIMVDDKIGTHGVFLLFWSYHYSLSILSSIIFLDKYPVLWPCTKNPLVVELHFPPDSISYSTFFILCFSLCFPLSISLSLSLSSYIDVSDTTFYFRPLTYIPYTTRSPWTRRPLSCLSSLSS
jgi:hypothetical protein